MNAQVAAISTLQAAPVVAGIRLRRGGAASAHGAGKLIGEALATARQAGATGLTTVRADSAYYQHETVAAARQGGARFPITARMNPSVVAAISRIPESAWVGIKYPHAIWEEAEQRWVSDAEVAEIDYTAFTSRKKDQHVAAWLIVRRVKRIPAGPGPGMTSCWRPTVTTRCSPTRPWECWKQRLRIVITRSSSRSSPTSRAGHWPTAPPGGSPPTVPGRCCRRSLTTSLEQRECWPHDCTPVPGQRPSGIS